MKRKIPNLDRSQELKKYFPIKKGLLGRIVGHVKAVDNVNFGVRRRDFRASSVSPAAANRPSAASCCIPEGDRGRSPVRRPRTCGTESNSELRDAEMQIIFQDPFGSLNPRFLVRDIIGEPLKVHTKMTKDEIDDRVIELMQHGRIGPIDSRPLSA